MTKPKYYIDIPNPFDLNGPWILVAELDSLEEAEKLAAKIFGAENGLIDLVSTNKSTLRAEFLDLLRTRLNRP